ncbi:MAG: PEGA domain-containing protein [Gemmatimonadetes bacterium]|nr:PEGA domain-containing protein [Gemmatimonadota bacterium]
MDTSSAPFLEVRYEPDSPLGGASHFPISLAVKIDVESSRARVNSKTLDDVGRALGFAPGPHFSEMIDARIVQEIAGRGLLEEVSIWRSGAEADYYLRVKLREQQTALVGRGESLGVFWQVSHPQHKLSHSREWMPSPLSLSSVIEVTLYTNTNLPIATKNLVLSNVNPDAMCGDYVWLGVLLREGPDARTFSEAESKLRRVRQIDGDHAIAKARECFAESYDLLAKEVMMQVADFSLFAIEAVEASPAIQEEESASAVSRVAVVIASIPSGADVMIDELFVGQTPLRYSVSRDEAHSVQLSAAGFEAMVKLIDPSSFGDESVQHLLYRLKAKPE